MFDDTRLGIAAASLLMLAACTPAAENGARTTADTSAPPASQPARPPADCEPLETRPKEAPHQTPAFEAQTRACEQPSNVAFDVGVVASGLVHPWAVEPLPDGSFLVTERPGRMRVITANGQVGEPLAGLPRVHAEGQAGLLDVALSPSFATDRTIFWSFSEPRDGGNGTSVARGVLSTDRTRLENVSVIFRALPTYANNMHYGSRLAFGSDGMLYISTGERSDRQMRQYAQRLDNHLGKVLRIRPDGTVPDDNPLVGRDGAQPEIWTIGHRNIQAMTFDPQGRLWVIEHGARGGDELNLIERGDNYGWPVQAYGIEYSGQPIAGASPNPGQFTQPVYYWDPVIAPSGATWYTGSAFPAWRGSLFIGALRDQRLVRVVIDGGRVVGEEHLLRDRGQRIRDVRQGPDGALYVVTDQENGQLWRISPR